MSNYSNSKIYKLVNDVNDEIYVGSTASTLTKRLYGHKYSVKRGKTSKIYSFMRDLGLEHFRIVLIEAFECKNKDELRKREQYYIDELKPCLNMCGAYRHCPHGRQHKHCKVCDGVGICEHNKRKDQCKVCSPVVCKVCEVIYPRHSMKAHYESKKHIIKQKEVYLGKENKTLNPFLEFIQTLINGSLPLEWDDSGNISIICGELYRVYLQWASTNNKIKVSKRQFNTTIRALNVLEKRVKVKGISSTNFILNRDDLINNLTQ